MWPEPQRIVYSSQDGQAANERLILEMAPLIERSKLRPLWESTFKGIGLQRIDWKSGSRISITAASESSGHGKTLDMVVCDEAWKDTDDRREQALLSSMITRPSSQILVISTAGTEASVYLARQRDMGRAAVVDGLTEGICYFEWSAPDKADIHDPEVWYSCMPGLGHTITEKHLRSILAASPEGSVKRMQFNQWTASEERVIPAASWDAVQREDLKLDREVVIFGLDVTPDRAKASITVVDAFKRCQLVESDLTPSEALSRAIEIGNKYDAPFVLEGSGPASVFVAELKEAGVKVVEYTTGQMSKACARLYDAIADGKIEIDHHDALDRAVAGAIKRIVLDSWTWSRKGTTDISPLVALTMAFDKAAGGDTIWMFKG